MCSLFGFVARKGQSIDVSAVAKIIRANICRGPHAFGFAWIDDRGRLRMFKQTGRMTDRLGALAMARDAVMLIGHLRYATHGDPGDNINNHPHACDGGWLVHNGVVHNNDKLIRAHQLHPVSACDSETLALLIEDGDGPLRSRTADALTQSQGNLALLGLWSRPVPTLLVARRGNPLHCAEGEEGLYLGSLAGGLPAHRLKVGSGPCVRAFRDNTVRIIKLDSKGRRHVKVQTIAAECGQDVSDDPRGGRLFEGGGDPAEYRGG